MKEKVILILTDGMRPDGFLNCGNPYINDIMANSTYSLNTQTVYPSDTLPCHMSLFTSCPPEVHNTQSNNYTPPTQRVKGLIEQIGSVGGHIAMFYCWEELRDITRPGALRHILYTAMRHDRDIDGYLTDNAVEYIVKEDPDFVFLYLGMTDDIGHTYGWMTEPYLKCVSNAVSCVKRVVEACGDDHTIILTADHGGQEYDHGSRDAVDMTIPLFLMGKPFEKGKVLENTSIMDIAPTITKLMDVPTQSCWQGNALL